MISIASSPPASALHAVFTRTLPAGLAAGFLLALLSCADGGPAAPGAGPSAEAAVLLPSLATAGLASAEAPPVNLVRITVEDDGSGKVLGEVEESVDPDAEQWRVEVTFEMPRPETTVRLLVELLNVEGGVETHAFSAEVGPVEVQAGETTEVPAEQVETVAGPPDNLAVTGVAIAAPAEPVVAEGATLALEADVETEDEAADPVVFWTSLDEELATVDGSGVVEGVLPGAARIVAEAGRHADTLEVTVRALPVRVVVRPDTARVEELGGTVTFTARVEDERGEPVESAELEWSSDDLEIAVSTGQGSFEILATGETRVRAAVASDPEITGSAMLIVETGPRILRPVEGDGEEAVVNTAVPTPPSVQVLDASDRPLAGVEVVFEVVEGDGTVTGATATSDEEGIARPEEWVLGTTAGTNVLEARIPEVEELEPVRFEARALPGAPALLEVVAGEGQEARGGTPVEVPPAVRVTDEFGNAVPGVPVTFEVDDFGGLNGDRASVEGSPAETDADGTATLGSWTLGVRFGTYALRASAGDADAVELSANALPTLTPAIDVGAGARSSCALNLAGEAYCWGSNGAGALGTEAVAPESIVTAPVAVEGGHLFQSLEVGNDLACGVTDEAELFCWGTDRISTVRLEPTLRPTPSELTPGFAWAQLGIGWSHACGVTVQGVAHCWGDNEDLQLGEPNAASHEPHPVPVGGEVDFEEVHASFFSSCGLAADGVVHCWGTNAFGALGDAQVPESALPRPIDTDDRFAHLDAGAVFYCAGNDGAASCWGANVTGQTGAGLDPADHPLVPVPLGVQGFSPLFDFGLSVENNTLMHACALDQEAGGTVLCWGFNASGELGADSPDTCPVGDQTFPCAWRETQVAAAGLRALVVDTGFAHTCAVTSDDEVVCWGGNGFGQLGDGGTVDSTEPVTVLQPRAPGEAAVSALRAPAGPELRGGAEPIVPETR